MFIERPAVGAFLMVELGIDCKDMMNMACADL